MTKLIGPEKEFTDIHWAYGSSILADDSIKISSFDHNTGLTLIWRDSIRISVCPKMDRHFYHARNGPSKSNPDHKDSDYWYVYEWVTRETPDGQSIRDHHYIGELYLGSDFLMRKANWLEMLWSGPKQSLPNHDELNYLLAQLDKEFVVEKYQRVYSTWCGIQTSNNNIKKKSDTNVIQTSITKTAKKSQTHTSPLSNLESPQKKDKNNFPITESVNYINQVETKTEDLFLNTQDHPGIYYITCLKSGCIYVGESVHVKTRWNQHANQLRLQTHHNHRLQKEFNNIGLSQYKFELIEPIHMEKSISFYELKTKLWAREIWHIRNLKSLGFTLHNLTDGGGDIADFNDMNISVTANKVSELLTEAKRKSLQERQHEPLNPIDANPINLNLVKNETSLPPSVPQNSNRETIPANDSSNQVVAGAPIASKNTGSRTVKFEENKAETSPILIFFVAIFVLFFASLPLLKFFNSQSDSTASPSAIIRPTPSLPRASAVTPAPSPPLERVNPEKPRLSTVSAREKAMELAKGTILRTESSKTFGRSSIPMLLVCVQGKDEIDKFASRIDEEDHELLGPLMSNVDLHNFKCSDLIFNAADVNAVRNGTFGKDASAPLDSTENSFRSPSAKPIKTIRESNNCDWGYTFESGGCQPIIPKQNEKIHITGKSTECKIGATRNDQGECKFPSFAPIIR